MANITGTNGKDIIYGTNDFDGDSIWALDGDDIIYLGSGARNWVDAGAGLDQIFTSNSSHDYVYGGSGNDWIYASHGNDSYDGGTGIDTVVYQGLDVNNQINLTTGIAKVYLPNGGGTNTHRLYNIENVLGGAGHDTIIGNDQANRLSGGAGNDLLRGMGGDDELYGGAGDDTLEGGAGNDRMWGGLGNDWLYGGTGNDIMLGEGGHDWLFGEDGHDALFGGGGNDRLYGGNGNDWLEPGIGNDYIDGGAGFDTLSYDGHLWGMNIHVPGGMAHSMNGQNEMDTFTGIEKVVGSSYADVIYAGATTEVAAGRGNDTVYSGNGANSLSGGDGNDTVSYFLATSGRTVNLANGTASDGDTLYSFENVTGSMHNDTLIGDGRANVLKGLDGHDTLRGGGGADVLVGGRGRDELWGGSGADRFVYESVQDSPHNGRDTIKDFSRAEGDKIDLSGLNLGLTFRGAYGGPGTVPSKSITIDWNPSYPMTWVYVNANTDQTIEMVINVEGHHYLTASDFIL